jgi:hypothetical protein
VIEDRPVWIVRYSNLTVHSPSGKELHYLYDLYDAASGQFLIGAGSA